MPLKAVLAKLEDVPVDQRTLYKASGDQFVLDVDGMVLAEEHDTLNTRLAEFRDNNITLKKQLDKVKDLDPVKYQSAITENAELKKKLEGAPRSDDIEVRIQQAIEKATEPLNRSVAEERAKRETAEQAVALKDLQDALWAVGLKAGVREESRKFWLQEATAKFKRENGELVAVEKGPDGSDKPLFSKRRGQAGSPMTPEEWAAEIAPTDAALAVFYKGSAGSGAADKGRQPVNNSGGQRVIPNDPAAISKSLEDIAAGRTIVQTL